MKIEEGGGNQKSFVLEDEEVLSSISSLARDLLLLNSSGYFKLYTVSY